MYTVGNGTNGIQLVPHTPEYCIQLFRVVPKGSVVPCAARVPPVGLYPEGNHGSRYGLKR